jgi:uncharacterized protein (TIGR01244 family)
LAPFKRLRTSIARRLFPDRARFSAPIRDAADRRAAWVDFLLVDFGILRLFWKNRARIAPRAWRMNQPWPSDIAWAARQGIRTIVTARHDPRHGGHALVAEAAARHGLAYVTFPLFSREAPSREALLAAPDFFARIEHPVLLHCKSGADRAGLLSALYLIVVEGVSVRKARKQLSLRFLHFSASRTGILDAVFEAYLAAHPDEGVPFLDWVARDYDPAALGETFRHRPFWDFLDRRLLGRE